MPSKVTANPFFVVLIAAALAFSITACAYGVMTVKLLDPLHAPPEAQGGQGLVEFLDRHGVTVMAVELAVLAAATFAAIGTDDFWTRRAARRGKQVESASTESASTASAKT